MKENYTRKDMIRYAAWTYQMEMESRQKLRTAVDEYDRNYYNADVTSHHKAFLSIVGFIVGLTTDPLNTSFSDEWDKVIEEIKAVYRERNE